MVLWENIRKRDDRGMNDALYRDVSDPSAPEAWVSVCNRDLLQQVSENAHSLA